MASRYYSVAIQRPLLDLETRQGSCSQCLAYRKVLVYRQPIQALIQGNQVAVGKEILFCLNCLVRVLKPLKKKEQSMPNLRIECQFCLTLWKVIGTQGRYHGRILINPYTSICYICEKEWGWPPIAANLWEWNEPEKKWEKWKGRIK